MGYRYPSQAIMDVLDRSRPMLQVRPKPHAASHPIERVDQIVQTLIEIGTRHNHTPAQVAIAWILDHPEVTAPILGADQPEHVDEAFAALAWHLPPEERRALDEVSEVEMPAKWA